MVNIPLPRLLIDSKLVIGDLNQIKLLNQYIRDCEEAEKEAEAVRLGVVCGYRVYIEITGDYEMEVMASSKEEAEEIAKNEFDILSADFDCEYSATIKNK